MQVHHPETETKELVRGTQRICHAWMPLLPSTTTKLPPAPASGSARLKERRAERVEKPEDIKEGLDSVYESKLSPRRSLSVDQKPAPPILTNTLCAPWYSLQFHAPIIGQASYSLITTPASKT